jgi:hypothetical protein
METSPKEIAPEPIERIAIKLPLLNPEGIKSQVGNLQVSLSYHSGLNSIVVLSRSGRPEEKSANGVGEASRQLIGRG